MVHEPSSFFDSFAEKQHISDEARICFYGVSIFKRIVNDLGAPREFLAGLLVSDSVIEDLCQNSGFPLTLFAMTVHIESIDNWIFRFEKTHTWKALRTVIEDYGTPQNVGMVFPMHRHSWVAHTRVNQSHLAKSTHIRIQLDEDRGVILETLTSFIESMRFWSPWRGG